MNVYFPLLFPRNTATINLLLPSATRHSACPTAIVTSTYNTFRSYYLCYETNRSSLPPSKIPRLDFRLIFGTGILPFYLFVAQFTSMSPSPLQLKSVVPLISLSRLLTSPFFFFFPLSPLLSFDSFVSFLPVHFWRGAEKRFKSLKEERLDNIELIIVISCLWDTISHRPALIGLALRLVDSSFWARILRDSATQDLFHHFFFFFSFQRCESDNCRKSEVTFLLPRISLKCDRIFLFQSWRREKIFYI